MGLTALVPKNPSLSTNYLPSMNFDCCWACFIFVRFQVFVLNIHLTLHFFLLLSKHGFQVHELPTIKALLHVSGVEAYYLFYYIKVHIG